MEPIFNEHNGFIDKYIGDAIMALFPKKADDAVCCAIAMLKSLVFYNAGRQRLGYRPIKIGIGLNTGTLMLGTVGGKNRMDGTVISDAVNVSSRVEGLTKIYSTALLITEATYTQLSDVSAYKIRLIDHVKVKGKTKSVTVYEVFDADPPEIIKRKQTTLYLFQQGIIAYYANEFMQAQQHFEHVLANNPDDKVSQIYCQRCQQGKTHEY